LTTAGKTAAEELGKKLLPESSEKNRELSSTHREEKAAFAASANKAGFSGELLQRFERRGLSKSVKT